MKINIAGQEFNLVQEKKIPVNAYSYFEEALNPKHLTTDDTPLQMARHPQKPFLKRIWNYIKSIFVRPKFSLNAIETITRDDMLKRMSIASEAQEKLKIDSLYLRGMDFGIDIPEEVFEFYKDHPCDNNACPLCQPEEGKNTP